MTEDIAFTAAIDVRAPGFPYPDQEIMRKIGTEVDGMTRGGNVLDTQVLLSVSRKFFGAGIALS